MALRLCVVIASVLAAGLASAADRVTVMPFSGPRGDVPREQIVSAVCGQVECVPQARVNRRGKPDWAKVRREKVALVVTGVVSGPANKRTLQLEGFDRAGKRQWRERLELARNGKLSRSGLEAVASRIVGGEEAKPAPEEKKPTRPADDGKKPTVVAEDEDAERGGRTRFTDDEERAARATETDEADADARAEAGGAEAEVTARDDEDRVRTRASRPIVIAEAGADLVHRTFAYLDLRQPNLRSYETRPVLFAPHVRVEAYPLARFMSGIPQGVGVEVDYLFAVGLRSIDENDLAHPTTVNRFDIGARLNFWPSRNLDLMVAPLFGYRSATFAVGPAEDGTELVGLPDIGYSALRVGATAEFGIQTVVTFARVEVLPVLGLGEIGSEAFFPDSGALAIDARAGAGYRVMKNFEARFTLHYTRYGLSFRPAEGATYSASGAVDQYAGGSLSARFSY